MATDDKNIVILKCDTCGKEKRIRTANLSGKEKQAVNSNNGCYCVKCAPRPDKQIAFYIHAGETFTVYPKMEKYIESRAEKLFSSLKEYENLKLTLMGILKQF